MDLYLLAYATTRAHTARADVLSMAARLHHSTIL